MVDLRKMVTEQQNVNSLNLDSMTVKEAVKTMNEEDKKVAQAVEKVLPEIEKAIEVISSKFRKGGRIIYVGAGTSGRLGILDAVECPPTFGTSPDKVVGLIAGGRKATIEAVEGAEDSLVLGQEDLQELSLSESDIVIGLAASGRTPYVIGALEYAKQVGSTTIAIACNKNSEIGQIADIAIEPTPGPEVLTGSTRLKAGTAQKMVLNIISTLTMVNEGKVYKNLMVDVQQTNDKLRSRAENIVIAATDAKREIAKDKLSESDGSVKLAILMILLDINKDDAMSRLKNAGGHISKAVKT